MLIKDEINVAYLLTSAKKIMKDRLRYNILLIMMIKLNTVTITV